MYSWAIYPRILVVVCPSLSCTYEELGGHFKGRFVFTALVLASYGPEVPDYPFFMCLPGQTVLTGRKS